MIFPGNFHFASAELLRTVVKSRAKSDPARRDPARRNRRQGRAGGNRRRSRGMAMLLVISAVAITAVLGYAVLANVGLQTQVSQNASQIQQAECLAESGFNYAMYALQNPSYAPSWPVTLGLGNGSPGTFTVNVTGSSPGPYTITSVSSVTGGNTSVLSRTIKAVVQVNTSPVAANQAVGFNGAPTINSAVNIVGDLRASGAVTLGSGVAVSGTVYAPALSFLSSVLSLPFITTPGATASVVPTTVTDYRTYTYNGVTYSATLLSTDPAAGSLLGPTVTNPAGIYYSLNRNLMLKGITVNGTLLSKSTSGNGGIIVQPNTTNTITPVSGFPGLVVDKQINMNGQTSVLTVNGLTWANQGITRSGSDNTGSIININGSLMVPSSTPISSLYNGTLNLKYVDANVNVSNFSTSAPVPKNLKVLSFSE